MVYKLINIFIHLFFYYLKPFQIIKTNTGKIYGYHFKHFKFFSKCLFYNKTTANRLLLIIIITMLSSIIVVIVFFRLLLQHAEAAVDAVCQ